MPVIPVEKIVPGARFVHVRTGGEYTVVMHALLELNAMNVVVYRSNSDGTPWVRPLLEFCDGRFAEVNAADWPAEQIGAELRARAGEIGVNL